MSSRLLILISIFLSFPAWAGEKCTKGSSKVIAKETKACEQGFFDQAKAGQRKITPDVKDYVAKICACSIKTLYADDKCIAKADVPKLSREALTKCVAEVPPPKVMQEK